ncbi:hypothetical protein EFM06_05080 [Lactobacillus helveticus]|uniref:mucin-binding protein n=1 Tax=Lactobacillus helveticus TaxID=1587 RepID=UPI0021820504|nr:hypothetical protein [Lactobacillus helveticus]MCT0164074.1 hypothetical protein [Lactobacillus helveticus]MCT0192569.1 hypothetical protein [Lactobacillus helveticus]MCT0197156.1 hypothetical protein [Lactobacillus helveticus]
MESITKTPTRTITVIKPDGSKLEIKQTVEFTRTATFDEVTGAVTYSDWKFAKSTAKGGKLLTLHKQFQATQCTLNKK